MLDIAQRRQPRFPRSAFKVGFAGMFRLAFYALLAATIASSAIPARRRSLIAGPAMSTDTGFTLGGPQ